jgi:hypothetical protein
MLWLKKKLLFSSVLKVGSTNACDGKEMQFPDRRDSDVPKWAEKTLDKIQIACRESK